MAVVWDERHEGPHTRTKVPQVDNGNDGEEGRRRLPGAGGAWHRSWGMAGWGFHYEDIAGITDHHRSSQIRVVQWETLALAPGMERVGRKLGRKRLTEALTARLRHLPLTL